MENFLSNRRSEPKFKGKAAPRSVVRRPTPKPAEPREKEAQRVPVAVNCSDGPAPKVELVMEGETVSRILITLPDGQELELALEY